MKKILVTGCNGQLGRAINKKYESVAEIELVNTDVAELNITSIEDTMKLIKEIKPYAIINCAAHTAVDACETDVDNAYKINALGPRNLSIAAEEVGAKMVHVSTDYVFVLIAAILYTLCLVAFLILPIYNKKKSCAILAICFVAFMLLSLTANLISINDDKVIYTSTENGDSIIMRSNSDTAVVYYGSHSASTAYEECELLEEHKINSLDYYIISNYSGRLNPHIIKILSLIISLCNAETPFT